MMKKQWLCLLLVLTLIMGSVPAAFAESPLDSYATGSMGEKQSIPVYSGPGEDYVRANNGKATYGGGAARIYGVTGDWVMIGYGLSSGDYRIGYVARKTLNAMKKLNGTIKELVFENSVAYADDYCRLTDDPVINNKMIYTIPEGTAVTVLAAMGKAWTYIEVETPSGLMRGFVWSIHLTGAAGQIYSNTPEPAVIAPTEAPVTVSVPVYTGSNVFYHDGVKGDWLPAYQELSLDGSWPVYSGPGEYYYRANNGKAMVGGGTCRVYGVENDWVLIGYMLSNGNYRIGYVSIHSLPELGLSIPYLDLRYTTRKLVTAASLTDDPVRLRPTLATLEAGSYVLFLGYLVESGETWAYVEALAGNSIMRGFIPAWTME